MKFGKLINGKIEYAPDTYTSEVLYIKNFNKDHKLMKEMGYKEVIEERITDDYKTIINIKEEEDSIKIIYDIDPSEENIKTIKEDKINLTKVNLDNYLNDNPLKSSVKGEELYYTVTKDKQNQLTSTVADFLSNALPIILAGTPIEQIDLPIYWNAQGDICEKWTYAEIYQLKNEMMSYVRPIVEYQRYLEKTIMEQEAQDKIYELDCHFTRDKIDKFIASRNEVPKDEVVDEVPEEPTDI